MRLLEVHSQKLKSFIGDDVPPYAILSHTWGTDEVLFEHIRDAPPTRRVTKMGGWKKVYFTCTQARKDGFDYVWIDTCCIDKSSSAELSEAINSMFRWYLRAAICYAYLSDVNDTIPKERFENSRWFTRGWTLQELIAPNDVIFYDCAWKQITSRQGLSVDQLNAVKRVTALPQTILRRNNADWCPSAPLGGKRLGSRGHDFNAEICRNCSQHEDTLTVLRDASSAEKMSWAARRQTTRLEDRAYSLFGLFGVTMPLLYGEGGRAFIRLQHEILKVSDDVSILAFSRPLRDRRTALLAESPDMFTDSQITSMVPLPGMELAVNALPPRLEATARYIETDVWICECRRGDWTMFPDEISSSSSDFTSIPAGLAETETWQMGVLACAYKDDLLSRPAIIMSPVWNEKGPPSFQRVFSQVLLKVSPLTAAGERMATARVIVPGAAGHANTLFSYDEKHLKSKTVRLLLQTNTGSGGDLIYHPRFDSSDTPRVSPAMMLSFSKSSGYTLHGAVPTTSASIKKPPPAIRPVRHPTSFSSWASIASDSDFHYFPPMAAEEEPSPNSLPWKLTLLGIICVSHESIEMPLLIVWGERREDAEVATWCELIPASYYEGYEAIRPSLLPAHVFRSEWFLRRLEAPGYMGKNSTDSFTDEREPFLQHGVSVTKTEWLGMPLFEIQVTLEDLRPTAEVEEVRTQSRAAGKTWSRKLATHAG